MEDELKISREAIDYFRRRLKEFSPAFELSPVKASGDEAALTSLYRRIASLANTGLLACAEGEIYAARALSRCLAEHWLRLMSVMFSSTPCDFFGELQEAEAIDIDRRMRNCFPNEMIPRDVPLPVRSAIEGALRTPPPTPDENRRAREVLQKYQFDKLFLGFLAALNVGDGRADGSSRGSMAFAYARFSACVHGGPLGHDYLVESPSAEIVVSTSSDLLATWATSLTMALAMTRGPEHNDTT